MAELNTTDLFSQALRHHKSGQLAEAERLYRQVLALQPHHPDALHMLGVLAHQAGHNPPAEQLIRQSISLRATVPAYHANLGMVLAAQGKLDEAITSYRQATALQPNDAETFNNLASILLDANKPIEAAQSASRALELKPGFPRAHYNLAAALRNQGDLSGAATHFEAATRSDSRYADAFNALGDVLAKQGQTDRAIATFRQAIAVRPNYPEAYNNLGNALRDVNRLRDAADAYKTALNYRPADPVVLNNLGTLLEGIPDTAEQSIQIYRRALTVQPDLATAHYNLANSFRKLGRLEEAIHHYRQALASKPDAMAAENLLYAIHFHPDFGPEEIAAEHRKWNDTFVTPLRSARRPHPNTPDSDRRLKVGYVSPDFREHPVGRFMLPLLSHHDHAQFQIYCYGDVRKDTPLTATLRQHADVWRDTSKLSDVDLAEQIRSDRIDILVDLAMHMENNRMRVFARKPAPVQVSYLAYASTTGNEAIDYRLTDDYLDPPELGQGPYIEKPIRLKSYWCFQGPDGTPDPGPPPSLSNGYVTFGCLNNFSKVSPAALSAWAQLLRDLPGSHLILHTIAAGRHKSILARFAAEGIAADRLELVGFLPTHEYFRLYNRIDVALDPFPYPGGTTTFDALWMGVPVVSMTGRTPHSRAGLTILTHLGHPEWVTTTVADYVRTAHALATDQPRRAHLRQSLRNDLQKSPLTNAPAFAKDVERACRAIWQTWCAQAAAGK